MQLYTEPGGKVSLLSVDIFIFILSKLGLFLSRLTGYLSSEYVELQSSIRNVKVLRGLYKDQDQVVLDAMCTLQAQHFL